MGMIRVEFNGSFGNRTSELFTAMERGHAAAVAAVIVYLAESELPRAVEMDHKLHDEGYKPSKGFGGVDYV